MADVTVTEGRGPCGYRRRGCEERSSLRLEWMTELGIPAVQDFCEAHAREQLRIHLRKAADGPSGD